MNGGKARQAGPKLSNEIVPPGQAYGAQSHRILLKDIQVKYTFFFLRGGVKSSKKLCKKWWHFT